MYVCVSVLPFLYTSCRSVDELLFKQRKIYVQKTITVQAIVTISLHIVVYVHLIRTHAHNLIHVSIINVFSLSHYDLQMNTILIMGMWWKTVLFLFFYFHSRGYLFIHRRVYT